MVIDATTVPPDVRHRVLMAAMVAVADVLGDADIDLDLFGRLELLELCLRDTEARFNAEADELAPKPN